MVRKARFSWDRTERFDPPSERDSFEEFEDYPFPLPGAENDLSPKQKTGRKTPPQQPPPQNRHLAGADWLGRPPADEA